MIATPNCRPLPIFLPLTGPMPVDEIQSASAAIADLYERLVDLVLVSKPERAYVPLRFSRDLCPVYPAGTADPEAVRLMLLAENLHHAGAEIAYRGTAEALGKICQSGKAIAARTGLEVRRDFPSMPDLDGWRCDPLPEFLGIGEPESEYDPINKVRKELDGLYDDARSEPHATRVDIALLWHGLSRAEAEMDYLGNSSTLDRVHTRAAAIADRLGVSLVDLDVEVAAMSRHHRELLAA